MMQCLLGWLLASLLTYWPGKTKVGNLPVGMIIATARSYPPGYAAIVAAALNVSAPLLIYPGSNFAFSRPAVAAS